jgi:hypothetical protein
MARSENTPCAGPGNTKLGGFPTTVRNTCRVQSAFGTVVLVVCGVGVAGAIAALLLGGRTWDEYSSNHLVRDSEAPRTARVATGPAAAAERDEEIRQMLEARNARRRRRGEPELDVERELGRLASPVVDDELRSEIRDLVIARNHRRRRRGQPELDVEAEIKRQIAELSQLDGAAARHTSR